MKHLLTAIACCLAVAGSAQVFWPYNPDSNGDNLVGYNDLLSFLSFFGDSVETEFAFACWLEEVEPNFNDQFGSSFWSNNTFRIIPDSIDVLFLDPLPELSSFFEEINPSGFDLSENCSDDSRRGFVLPDGCQNKVLCVVSTIHHADYYLQYFIDQSCEVPNENCQCTGDDDLVNHHLLNQIRLNGLQTNVLYPAPMEYHPYMSFLARWNGVWFVME